MSTGQLVERWRVGLWSWRSEVQISIRSNRTQCCQRFATAAKFLPKELCCPGAMTGRWAPLTRYMLRRNAASIIKDWIWLISMSCFPEVESRTQGSRPKTEKYPRPRTDFPRTDPLEAKDRNARGQGPKTQPKMFFKKKKGFQKSFSGNLQFIGVAWIFNLVGAQTTNHMQWCHQKFSKE